MKARKGNKEYTISEDRKDFFVKKGFDIFDENGEKVANGAGKSVSVEAYEKLKEELNELKATAVSADEHEKVQAENAKLKEEVKKLKADAKKE